MPNRREFFKLTAAASAAFAMADLIPESIQRAFAIEPEAGSTYLDAEHIVILMQENRSFDHAFGTLRGVRGFNDPRGLRLRNGNPVFVQTDNAGHSYAPWRLNIHDTRITWMGSLPHSRHSQVDAWSEGRHDGWLEAKRSGTKKYADLPLTMGYYTREDLPFYYAMADAFTVCDQNYCSAMTSTSPNRCYFWTGTIRDEQHPGSNAHIRNEQIDDGGMDWKTFPERLQEAGIRWKSYQNELTRSGLSGQEDAWLSNFGDNVLECFNAYNVEAYPGYRLACRKEISELSRRLEKLRAKLLAKDAVGAARIRDRIETTQRRMEAVKQSQTDSGERRYRQLSEDAKALHHAAFVTNDGDPFYRELTALPFDERGNPSSMQVPRGDVLHQFRKDVCEGTLPTVSWLIASERFSDHPSAPWYGAWYISQVMDILTKNPEVWKKTIFILTYDENDGYFDHAPSYVAADPRRPETGGASAGIDTGLEYIHKEDELRQGVAEEEARTGPIGMGFRVPMVIASPWSRGGWVNSQLFDHTSTLMFLESFVQKKFGKTVRAENISAWRRAIAGDLSSVFRPYDPKEKRLDFLDRDKFLVGIEKARFKEVPSNYKALTAEQITLIQSSPRQSGLIVRQEEGLRPSCALPYELYADGTPSEDGHSFELCFTAGSKVHGSQSIGAPFNVYLRTSEWQDKAAREMLVATYVVSPGDTLKKLLALSVFEGGDYFIEVHAPNGFYRCFTGKPGSSPLTVHTSYEREGTTLTGNVCVKVGNMSGDAIALKITDNSYGTGSVEKKLAASGVASLILDLRKSHGWYDFTVKSEGTHGETRYAGRVETGRSSFSDPLMSNG